MDSSVFQILKKHSKQTAKQTHYNNFQLLFYYFC